MPSRPTSVARIQGLIEAQSYRIGLHAVRHMIEEGFDEYQLLQAMKGQLRVIEVYPEEKRYLLLENQP